MAFKPGQPRPANAGRKKGSVNKKTKELQDLLDEYDLRPGEELIRCYRDARRIFRARVQNRNLVGAVEVLKLASSIMEDVAQYTYPKKKAVEHSGEVGIKTFADFVKFADDDSGFDDDGN